MLSPTRVADDEDDDHHLCIKCNATVHGLHNYVNHRKQLCGKFEDNRTKKDSTKGEDSEVIPILESIDPSLGADVFFQSLELQSSSKKITSQVQRTTFPALPKVKSAAGVKTRRAIAALQTLTTTDTNRVSPVDNKQHGSDWIGGHSIRLNSNADNETRLINAVASISGHAKKVDTRVNPYSLYEDESNEDSDDFDELEEEDIHASSNKWKPPTNYTGGKWKPENRDEINWAGTGDMDVWDLREEPTGGKWKPQMKLEDEDDYDIPPPGHTRGKWVPGAKDKQESKSHIMFHTIQSKGSVQYWCGPCNRRLASRIVYEKHLLTNLHFKKICLENDLEFAGHLDNQLDFGKRLSKPSQYTDGSVYSQMENVGSSKLDKPVKKKRKRRKLYMSCPGCKSKVKCNLMGKHLISHFHFRRATVSGEFYCDLIIENMEKIVHQSPFQCSPCKFYTNRFTYFIQHWYSKDHKLTAGTVEGRYWCSFCKYECDESDDMLTHLNGSEHQEVIAVINRSMPIIIRKRSVFKCEECFKEFRFNIESKVHAKKTNHALPITATDGYQEISKCSICVKSFKTSVSLAAHLKSYHNQKEHVCILCSKIFKNAKESKQHRSSASHRIKHAEKVLKSKNKLSLLWRMCVYCKTTLSNTIELKEHINKEHPEVKPKCSKCGAVFTLPQEVSQHIRKNECSIDIAGGPFSKRWHCSKCLYSTDSQAECYFHEVTHNPPIQEGISNSNAKFKCPLCDKMFSKKSLRPHLRQHTEERPYHCTQEGCKAKYSRWSSLKNHQRKYHERPSDSVKRDKVEKKKHKCSICGDAFRTPSKLERHLAVHYTTTLPEIEIEVAEQNDVLNFFISPKKSLEERNFPCGFVGCSYAAKTQDQLRRHSRIHGERVLKHECTLCNFKTDQGSHLKSHLLIHEGKKPYHCPHCAYSSATLENLRKHALKLRSHRGLPLYECKECALPEERYVTNMATDLRAHLVAFHRDKFDKKSAVSYASTYFFKPQES